MKHSEKLNTDYIRQEDILFLPKSLSSIIYALIRTFQYLAPLGAIKSICYLQPKRKNQ